MVGNKELNQEPLSLGKAIQALKPDVDANAEAKKANKQAKKDIRESES